MHPNRHPHEEEYYTIIIDRYQQLLKTHDDPEIQQFVANELTDLMHELERENEDRPLMKQIAQNIMILLLSLFEKKDSSSEYQNYSELTECQRNIIRRQLAPELFNHLA